MQPPGQPTSGDKIETYLARTFMIDFKQTGSEVDEDTDLIGAGIIDSFAFVQLIAFLEKTFRIKITDGEALSDRLRSLASMRSFVDEKLSKASR